MQHESWSIVLIALCLLGLVNCTTNRNTFVGSQGEVVAATSGTPQSHTINAAFATPLVVTVTNSGSPATGVVVNFAAPTTGASGKFADTGTAVTTATTDANGLATSAAFIANGITGVYTITASAQGAQSVVTFSLTNTTGSPAAAQTASGTGQSAGINSSFAFPLQVKVTDAGDNPVQYATVVFTAPASGASGTFADTGTNTTSATTDANGVATSTAFTANSTSGPDSVTATVAGVSTPATFNLTNIAGVPVTITAASGTPQRTVIGKPFSAPLVAKVFDSFSNPVSGVAVTFSAPASGASGTFSNGTTTETDTTDVNGLATSTVVTANGTNGGPYAATAAVPGVATPADFNLTNTLPFKTYAFFVSGEELTSTFYALAGAVQIDTAGNVLAGEQDYNDGGTIASFEPAGDTITGGTLQVSSTTGQGTLTLNTSNSSLGVGGTETFGVQFVNAAHALINQFDGSATSSGSIDVQTLPATLDGAYAFTLTGVDPFSSAVDFGGVFTISGGTTLQNGLLDTNDQGTATTGSSLTGTISTPDSFGRGTINSTMNYTSLVGIPAPVVLNYYVVGPEVLRIIDVDSANNGSASSDSAIGSAFGQGVNATNATTASLGNSVFGMIGNTLTQFAAAGMFATNSSSGTISGIADANELTNALQSPASPISGNYLIGNNGYGSITTSLGDISLLGLYLTDPNLNLSDPNNTSAGLGGALVADMGGILSGGTGVLIPQTDTSTANFTGKYAFGGQAFASLVASGEFDFIGQGKVTKGAIAGTSLLSDPFFTLTGSSGTNSGVKFGDTPLPDPGNPGRYTMSATNSKPNPLRVNVNGTVTRFEVALYQATGGQLFWVNEDVTSTFLGSLQQQGSLTALPLAAICCNGSSNGMQTADARISASFTRANK